MPKVLTKLRIDEISSVDKGAGDGCRIVLYKRDAGKAFEKATYRGASGSKLNMIQNLSPDEAKHFLLHDAHGRQLQRDFRNIPFNDLAGYVCEASRRKPEVRKMDKPLEAILKSETAMHALCKQLADNGGSNVTHPQFDGYLARYAKNQHPTLRLGTAIAKVLAEETPVARAYAAVHAFFKAQPEPVDEEEDDEDDEDALAELNRLAEEERRRENGMSKAQAFTKVYQDPANARLAQRERAQNRPR